MMRGPIALAVLVILVALGLNSVFVVDEREKALVLRFGEVQQVKTEPGLGFKIPVVDTVVKYDDRILSLTTQPLEVTPEDDRRLVVDAFARWRIVDVVKFREAVGAGGEQIAKNRIDGILNNAIREVLGSVPSTAVLSDDRTPLMNRIRDLARREASSLGVDVIDVRLTRTDLPEQNLAATYGRMRAEREREAADERARGAEAAQRVRATADRTAVEVTSQAKKEAEIVRGEADAQANKIYADAYGKDPEFFAFNRALQFYAQSMKTQTSSLVTQPDSLYFDYERFLRSIGEKPGAGVANAAGQ
ncbi:MAG: protease modulator HflC [Thioclava marina]|nr:MULTISPECIES: protease modulator HflC [Thioclava]MBC7146946.1 protease modulator HflC [Thioclava marina]MBD3804340.1 protease modulator HflC [Thioclava sp.]TNF16913.1 MAG: protease modulator HflC [Paracoccaceae bacterium]